MVETFGDRLRLERLKRRIPQKVLAGQVGITGGTLCDYESNRAYPSVPHLRILAQALGVSADYLLGLTHTPA